MMVFDFGRLIYAYNTISEAARNGARVAIVNQRTADICQVSAERAVALTLPAGCQSVPTAVGVYVTPTAAGRGCTAISCVQTVQVTYQFRAITPLISTIVGPITVSSASKMPVESLCWTAGCPLP